MMNPLYNRYGGGSSYIPQNKNNNFVNLLKQFSQVQRNPSAILDILLNNGKINQQQYNDLQPYRNNPQQIFNYLMNNGKANELNIAQQQAMQYND